MIVAIAGATISKAIVLQDYQLNKNYIATTLCEKRNNASYCCQDECFLKKQLQKDKDSGKNHLSISKYKLDAFLFAKKV
jgi:hypothetical protein